MGQFARERLMGAASLKECVCRQQAQEGDKGWEWGLAGEGRPHGQDSGFQSYGSGAASRRLRVFSQDWGREDGRCGIHTFLS